MSCILGQNSSGAKERFLPTYWLVGIFLFVAFSVAIHAPRASAAMPPLLHEVPFTSDNEHVYQDVIAAKYYSSYYAADMIEYLYFNEAQFSSTGFDFSGASIIATSNSGEIINYLYTRCYASGEYTGICFNTYETESQGPLNLILYGPQSPTSDYLITTVDIDSFEANHFIEIPAANYSDFTLRFDYPRMYGPVFHADIKMTEFTSHVAVRTDVDYPLVLSQDVLSHVVVAIVKMTDNTYEVVDTTDPYLEQFNLTEITNGKVDFSVPLLGGTSEYFKAFLAFDDDYLEQHEGPAIISQLRFSLTGLFSNEEGYDYAQNPFLPPVDGEGNLDVGSDSIVGGLIDNALAESWFSIKNQFSDFFTIADIVRNAPTGASDSAIYSGTMELNGHIFPFDYDPFHAWPIPPIVPLIMTYVAYIGLAFFLIRKLSNIFPE